MTIGLVAQLLRPIVISKVCTLQVKLCNANIDFDLEGQYFNIFAIWRIRIALNKIFDIAWNSFELIGLIVL